MLNGARKLSDVERRVLHHYINADLSVRGVHQAFLLEGAEIAAMDRLLRDGFVRTLPQTLTGGGDYTGYARVLTARGAREVEREVCKRATAAANAAALVTLKLLAAEEREVQA